MNAQELDAAVLDVLDDYAPMRVGPLRKWVSIRFSSATTHEVQNALDRLVAAGRVWVERGRKGRTYGRTVDDGRSAS